MSGHVDMVSVLVVLYSQSDGQGQGVNLRHLTSGSWEVIQILAYDESAHSV